MIVSGVDDELTATNEATDNATINVTDVAPLITVDKLVDADQDGTFADSETVAEGTRDVTYQFTITADASNASTDPVTVTAIGDDRFGDLLAEAVSQNGGADIVLNPGETYTFTYTTELTLDDGELGEDPHTNVVIVSGVDDELTATNEATDNATINVTDVAPLITVDKLVDADGNGTFNDVEGMVEGTHDVTYQFTITADPSNASTDPVTVIAISDDRLDPAGTILLAAAEATNGGTITLDPGESFTFTYTTELTLADGALGDDPHINVVTVSGVDDEGTGTGDAIDDATIQIVAPGMVTNSSLCDFGEQFDLVFTPDLKNWDNTPAYKLSDSNPGQFYYNTFFTPKDVGDGDGEFELGETLTIDIPYPFVTQGANPVHAYSNFTLDEHGCFIPGDEKYNGGSELSYDLEGYTDTNGDGVIGYGDTYTMTIYLDRLQYDGFVYLNVHLDYGLEKTNGWDRSGGNAVNDPNVNLGLDGVDIMNLTDHTFDSSIAGSTDSIANNNTFKDIKGFGGLVVELLDNNGTPADTSDDLTQAIEGATVELYKADANGNQTGSMLDLATTDEHGWYFMENFTHKGECNHNN